MDCIARPKMAHQVGWLRSTFKILHFLVVRVKNIRRKCTFSFYILTFSILISTF